jgi:hypothetical protein
MATFKQVSLKRKRGNGVKTIECKPYPCERQECKDEWDEIMKNADGLDFAHCEYKGCHSFYWEDDNGFICEPCGIKYCDTCSYYNGEFTSDELFICNKCLEDGIKYGTYKKCGASECDKVDEADEVKICKICNNNICGACQEEGKTEDDEDDNKIFTCKNCLPPKKQVNWGAYWRNKRQRTTK